MKCPKCGAQITVEGKSVKVVQEFGRPLCEDCLKKLRR